MDGKSDFFILALALALDFPILVFMPSSWARAWGLGWKRGVPQGVEGKSYFFILALALALDFFILVVMPLSWAWAWGLVRKREAP